MPRCRSPKCGQEIIWANGPSGKVYPLTARKVQGYHLSMGDAVPTEDGPVYVLHHVTCRDPEMFQSKRPNHRERTDGK